MKRKLFCEINDTTYKISVLKGIALKNIQDLFSGQKFAKTYSDKPFDNILKSHSSVVVRKLHGVDIELQENKKTNLLLAAATVNGLVVQPGEVFSFWRCVGRPTEKKGYKEGLTISGRLGLGRGVGGGLCQLANMVHWLALHSPLETVELHHHSDALFPDEARRVPFGTGTSVFYNRLDYRFRNTMDQPVQILVWIEDGFLCGELRSVQPLEKRYKITEENHHFRKEGDEFFRISQVYKIEIDKKSGEEKKTLILDNHSKVLYDYSLIPTEQIR